MLLLQVWDDTARFCRGYVRPARQLSDDISYTNHQPGDWVLGLLWLMEARAEIAVFATTAAGQPHSMSRSACC